MTERWKPVVINFSHGFGRKVETPYEISCNGKLRHKFRRKNLKPNIDIHGSLTAQIKTSDGVPLTVRISRLVGQAFCPSFKPHLRPVYRDGDKTNCSASNLKWVAQSKVTGVPYSKNPKNK